MDYPWASFIYFLIEVPPLRHDPQIKNNTGETKHLRRRDVRGRQSQSEAETNSVIGGQLRDR